MNQILNLPVADLIPFADIDEKRPALLVTSNPAWNAVKDRLHGLNVAAVMDVSQATSEHWERLLSGCAQAQFEVVYAIGGGLSADAAKYLAIKLDLPLTVVPTALSVDAFITAASGIRRDGCVYYLPTKVPEQIILDFEVIAAAPASIRAAGITDVMSIATGCWDWKFAHEQGMNPKGMEFVPWVYENAQSILNGALDCAEAAGGGDAQGLKTLYDCLAMEVQLCNQMGHARPEEGSEHYFAYCAENFTGHGWPHGDLVGPGILLMARLQGQPTQRYEAALKSCNIPLDRISAEATAQTLKTLPSYCKKHGLAFGLAHTLQ
jgi:glycerol-1-phosphate dehydrogenase [NAD(P)+]